jgi:hypothetical protein
VLAEGLSKMALIGKTGHERDLAHGQIGLFEEALRGLKAAIHDILMGTFSGRLPKAACKVKGAQSALLGNLG